VQILAARCALLRDLDSGANAETLFKAWLWLGQAVVLALHNSYWALLHLSHNPIALSSHPDSQ